MDFGENAYAEYILFNADYPICNGDMLTKAMENDYLLEEFLNQVGES
jgi:hypothetical protein